MVFRPTALIVLPGPAAASGSRSCLVGVDLFAGQLPPPGGGLALGCADYVVGACCRRQIAVLSFDCVHLCSRG